MAVTLDRRHLSDNPPSPPTLTSPLSSPQPSRSLLRSARKKKFTSTCSGGPTRMDERRTAREATYACHPCLPTPVAGGLILEGAYFGPTARRYWPMGAHAVALCLFLLLRKHFFFLASLRRPLRPSASRKHSRRCRPVFAAREASLLRIKINVILLGIHRSPSVPFVTVGRSPLPSLAASRGVSRAIFTLPGRPLPSFHRR